MGIIGSRMRRHRSRAELLEMLEASIRKKENDKRNSHHEQRAVKRCFITSSILLYIILIILNLQSLVPDFILLIYPVIAIAISLLITRYYTKAQRDSHYELYTMREEKKKLIDEVKHSETYMVAKEILERYGSSEDLLRETNLTNNPSTNSQDATIVDIN